MPPPIKGGGFVACPPRDPKANSSHLGVSKVFTLIPTLVCLDSNLLKALNSLIYKTSKLDQCVTIVQRVANKYPRTILDKTYLMNIG